VTIDTSQNVTFVGSQTLSGGTANGVLYLNGSKAATSGSALTFDGTSVFSITNADSRFVGGTSAGRLIISNSSTSTYIGVYGASHATLPNILSFVTNAVNTMTLDASGNLGVGTTTIGGRITTNGTASILPLVITNSSTSGYSGIHFISTAGVIQGHMGFGNSAVAAPLTSSMYIGSITSIPLLFTTTDTERARITAGGNLLVGTTNVYNSERLVVDSNGGSTAYNSKFVNSSTSNTTYSATTWSHGQSGTAIGYVGVGGSAVSNGAFANNFVVGTQSASALVFTTSDSEKARITSGGNFGIGNTNPTQKLVVDSAAFETAIDLNCTSSGGKSYSFCSGGSSGAFGGGRFGLYSRTDNQELFAATSNTAGTAGGTTGKGVGFTHAGFWIDRGWADFPSMTVCSTNNVGNTNQSQIRMHGTNATWASYPSAAGSDFACSFFIDGTYQTSSDRRFKTNITNIDNALDKVMAMAGKRYQTVNKIGEVETAASQSGYKYGFIAQDLQAAGLDELYKHYADEDDFTEGYNKAYSVEYDAVVPLLVNAIKEQQALIETLTQRITALEGR
jgi:hypothetical protein